MKLTTAAAATIMAFLAPTAVVADFDIYYREYTAVERRWHVLDSEAQDCKDIEGTRFLKDRDDVSGTKFGARCKGDGCKLESHPSSIEQLELHFNDGGSTAQHFTLYKDRDWTFWDGNTQLGSCVPAEMTEDQKLSCSTVGSSFNIAKQFFCKSDKTVDDLWLP